MKTAEEQLDAFFSRGIATSIDPNDSFRKKLEAKIRGEYDKEIIVKFGVDPTRPDIHLGHAVAFWKLRMLQDFGCKVVFLVGDITAQIGDPTGKSKVRPEISFADVEKNMNTFLEQASKILRTDEEVFTWTRNSDWFLSPMDMAGGSFTEKWTEFSKKNIQLTRLKKEELQSVTFLTFLATLRKITYNQLIDRDMFQERLKRGEELYMHELMYPVMQGMDSAIIAQIYGGCDLEMGGTDQEFNMLMGRKIMQIKSQEPQAVMTCELLIGTDGKEKMSKSLDNFIAITDSPKDIVGKIMSVPDTLIVHYATLCTDMSQDELDVLSTDVSAGKKNPRDLKLFVAKEIIRRYYNMKDAEAAALDFLETFSNKTAPKEIQSITAEKGEILIDTLVREKIVESKTAFKRLLDGGAVTNIETGEKLARFDSEVSEPIKLKIGKKIFIQVLPA
jgi:tyrosyl-tRNA synthetase